MTLPASGPISLMMIRNEFGGPTPVHLNQYYRGGGRVPNTPANAAIPTSGAISLSDFYGATAYTPPTIVTGQEGGYLFLSEPAPTSQTVNAVLTASGTAGSGTFSWEWRSAPGGPVLSTASSLAVSANVVKNGQVTVNRHLSWSDGVTSGSQSVGALLRYETNI